MNHSKYLYDETDCVLSSYNLYGNDRNGRRVLIASDLKKQSKKILIAAIRAGYTDIAYSLDDH